MITLPRTESPMLWYKIESVDDHLAQDRVTMLWYKIESVDNHLAQDRVADLHVILPAPVQLVGHTRRASQLGLLLGKRYSVLLLVNRENNVFTFTPISWLTAILRNGCFGIFSRIQRMPNISRKGYRVHCYWPGQWYWLTPPDKHELLWLLWT